MDVIDSGTLKEGLSTSSSSLHEKVECVLCGWDENNQVDVNKGHISAYFKDDFIVLSHKKEGEENDKEIITTSIHGITPDGTLNPRDTSIFVNQLEKLTGLDRLDIDGCVRGLLDEVSKKGWCAGDKADCNNWLGRKIPDGYTINNGCVNFKVYDRHTPAGFATYIEKPICYTPFTVTAIGKDIDKGDHWLEISFKNIYGDIQNVLLTQKEALSKPGMLQLISKGVNATEKQTPALNEYISMCIRCNYSTLEQMVISDKTGWKEDNSLFAFGGTGYKNNSVVRITSQKEKEYVGLRANGDIGEWIANMKPILHYPLIRFKMYVVLTAPLLRLLSVPSFIVDHYGESGDGKSASWNIAISLIGNYEKLKFNGDATKTAAEVMAETYTDLPLYLDEMGTQQKAEMLQALIYMIGNEQGRMRGKKEGGLRDPGSWKTVALTTGERPIVNIESFTGQQVRVLEISEKLDFDQAIREAEEAISDNYGHVTELYFKMLFLHKRQLLKIHKIMMQRFINDVENTVTITRLIKIFAAIQLAGTFLEAIFSDLGIESVEPHIIVDQYFKKCVVDEERESYSHRALKTIIDWVEINQRCFAPREKNYSDFYGWDEPEYVDIISTALKKMMKEGGYDYTRTLNDLIQEEVIIVNKHRKDYQRKHNGRSIGVIRIDKSKADHIILDRYVTTKPI